MTEVGNGILNVLSQGHLFYMKGCGNHSTRVETGRLTLTSLYTEYFRLRNSVSRVKTVRKGRQFSSCTETTSDEEVGPKVLFLMCTSFRREPDVGRVILPSLFAENHV